jgi:hypothetical protein
MVLIAAVPGFVLGRWFDRQPARMSVAGPPVPVVRAVALQEAAGAS